jgi:hypothetical protein
VKFQPDTNGFISGIRFYKGSGNTGSHIGNLWSNSGALLSSATFAGETASGWQQVNFDSQVPINANTTYVASYYAPLGHYSADQTYFNTSFDRAPLHALSSATAGGNGVYAYSGGSTFPSNTYNATNYWVDVVFSTTAPATATPTATPTITVTPTATPTATLPICPCTIWPSSALPANPSRNSDRSSVEVGVKFRSDVNAHVTALRFYKGASNTGTHMGSLWTSAGSLLASATYSGETASGWQQVTLASPIAVSANTTYIASYHAPVGQYAADQTYFDVGFDRSPLHALSSASSGGDGVYAYAAAQAFPTNSYKATNYWVDVVITTP